MESLNIEKFSPKKADLILLAEKSKGLTINGVEDKQGYALVHETRMKLKNARVEITKIGKDLRADALSFQKAVIEKEKELIAIIEPSEIELEEKQKAIDLEKEMIKRKDSLPERIEKLAEINIIMQDEFILVMDDNQFQEFYNAKKAEYLEEKERQLKAEQEEIERKNKEAQDKIESDKRKLEEERRIEEARKQAEKEAQEKALKDVEIAKQNAEREKKEAVEAEKRRAEEEKSKIIEEQKRKEQERIDAEKLKEKEEEARLKLEMEEAEKLEKRKKYLNFLAKNGYTEETKSDFIINRDGNKFTMFKKVASIII